MKTKLELVENSKEEVSFLENIVTTAEETKKKIQDASLEQIEIIIEINKSLERSREIHINYMNASLNDKVKTEYEFLTSNYEDIFNDINSDVNRLYGEIAPLSTELTRKTSILLSEIDKQFTESYQAKNDEKLTQTAEIYTNFKTKLSNILGKKKSKEIELYLDFSELRKEHDTQLESILKTRELPSRKEIYDAYRTIDNLGTKLERQARKASKKTKLKAVYKLDNTKLEEIKTGMIDTLKRYDNIVEIIKNIQSNKRELDRYRSDISKITTQKIPAIKEYELKIHEYELKFPRNPYLDIATKNDLENYQKKIEELSNHLGTKKNQLINEVKNNILQLGGLPEEPTLFKEVKDYIARNKEYRMRALPLAEKLLELDPDEQVIVPSREKRVYFEMVIIKGNQIKNDIEKGNRIPQQIKKAIIGKNYRQKIENLEQLERVIEGRLREYGEARNEPLLKPLLNDYDTQTDGLMDKIKEAYEKAKTKKDKIGFSIQKKEKSAYNQPAPVYVEVERKPFGIDHSSLPIYVESIGYPANFDLLPIRKIILGESKEKTWEERFSGLEKELGKLNPVDKEDKSYLSKIAQGINNAIRLNDQETFPMDGATRCYNLLKQYSFA